VTLEGALIVCGLAAYVVASALAVLRLARPDWKGERAMLISTACGVILFAAVLLMHAVRSGRVPAFGRFESLTCYAVAVSAAFLALAARRDTRGMGGILLPYVAVLLAVAVPGATE